MASCSSVQRVALCCEDTILLVSLVLSCEVFDNDGAMKADLIMDNVKDWRRIVQSGHGLLL